MAPQNKGPEKPKRGFQPGQSGNPGGRPKALREVMELARSHSVEAIETLARLMRSAKHERTRLAAAVTLLDRGWGKPAQAVEVTGSVQFEGVSDAELEQRAVDLLKARGVGSLGDGARKPH